MLTHNQSDALALTRCGCDGLFAVAWSAACHKMYASLLKTLRKATRLEQTELLYSQFTHVPSPPGRTGLCSVDRCASDFVSAGGSNEDWALCPEHYLLTSRGTRRKHLRALFWQAAITNCFSDKSIFDRIIASGHDRKLSRLMENATERVTITWRMVVLEAHTCAKTRKGNGQVKLRTRRSSLH